MFDNINIFSYVENFLLSLNEIVLVFISIIVLITILLVFVAYYTYAERKVIAAMQIRKGPNVVGPYGLLQPLADGVKLFLKEIIIPTNSNTLLFLLAQHFFWMKGAERDILFCIFLQTSNLFQ